jgi:8-oxo-dGTP diphosphatase
MEKFQLLAVVNIILIKDQQVLLTRRFNTGYHDGYYELPSGHVDGKETITKASCREALEEVGVVIQPQDLSVVHVMHRYGEKHERIEFFLLAKAWEEEPYIKEPEECDDMQWFPLDALPENMIPKSRAGLEKYIAKEPYSEFGWE